MRRADGTRRAGSLALCAVLLALPEPARADAPPSYWRASGSDTRRVGSLAFDLRTSLTVTTFERPERACGAARTPGRDRNVDPLCPLESNEVAVGFGLGLAFRWAGPLHLSWGIDVAFTDPQDDVFDPQTVVTMPFGVALTWTEWSVRPIVEALATPFLLVPDGVKSVLLGGRMGGAIRLGDLDLALTVGYAEAETMRPWEVRLALVHLDR